MNPLNGVYSSERRDFAYELKFILDEAAGEAALAWARQHLCPDPHANGSANGAYQVNSLYLDTPQLDVYHRVGSYGRCKYRVRRYGSEEAIFLERKLKSRGQVGKRRTRIPNEELALLNREPALPAWPGHWFLRRLLARDLSPRCQIIYARVALVGMSSEGPVRLTLDRDIRTFPTADWLVAETNHGTPLLTNQRILELKFRSSLPAIFQSLIEKLGLSPQAVSKYRLSIEAFGWDQPSDANGNGHPTDAPTPMGRSLPPSRTGGAP